MCVCPHVNMDGLKMAHLLLLGDVEDMLHCQWKDTYCYSSETNGGKINHILLCF